MERPSTLAPHCYVHLSKAWDGIFRRCVSSLGKGLSPTALSAEALLLEVYQCTAMGLRELMGDAARRGRVLLLLLLLLGDGGDVLRVPPLDRSGRAT